MYNDHFNGTTNIGQIRVIVFIFSSLNKKNTRKKKHLPCEGIKLS